VQTSPSRAERKEQTRQALLDGAVALAAERGFSAVSLREIAKSAGIVPTAFYRHFASLDELGAALVEDGVLSLRLALREVRRASVSNIGAFVTTVFGYVRTNRTLLGFLVRERNGGSVQLRTAIDTELRLIAREFATDLSRVPELVSWSVADLEMTTELLVSTVTTQVGAYIAAGPEPGARATSSTSTSEAAVAARTERQLRLIALGMAAWKPRG
jgi:AcrR family transcriptional regulator